MTTSTLPRGDETVLVVDDDPQIRGLIARVLARLGYGVLEAPNPTLALDLAQAEKPDILVMDVILPLMSGLTLAHKISRLRPDVRVLYTSGFTREEVLEDLPEPALGVDFMAKPFTPGTLARKVRALLDREITPAPPPPPPPMAEGETVLVVDDDPETRSAMARGLARFGYRVLDTGEPDEARVLAEREAVDLVVMDIVLPLVSGLVLAHAMSRARPSLRFLYVSGKATAEVVAEHGVEDPDVAFLAKPFTPEEIAERVRTILDRP